MAAVFTSMASGETAVSECFSTNLAQPRPVDLPTRTSPTVGDPHFFPSRATFKMTGSKRSTRLIKNAKHMFIFIYSVTSDLEHYPLRAVIQNSNCSKTELERIVEKS